MSRVPRQYPSTAFYPNHNYFILEMEQYRFMPHETRIVSPITATTIFSEPKITNLYMRFIYSLLLHEFRSDIICDYFGKYCLTIDNRRLSETDAFEHFWDDREFTPQEYAFMILNDLEGFFLSHQKYLIPILTEKPHVPLIMPALLTSAVCNLRIKYKQIP
jgi:hypothetical protein